MEKEKWHEIFKNKIPQAQYKVLLQNGEEEGLTVKLISSKLNTMVKFGVVSSFRMLDEGMALNGLFDDEQIECFRNNGFSNVIYQITDGEFDGFMRQISGNLYECLEMKHYVIISTNYIIEIITEWDPEIQIIEN